MLATIGATYQEISKMTKPLVPNGMPLCHANLEMKSQGSWTKGNRRRMKFRCPIKTDRKTAQHCSNSCPISHPKFDQGNAYGCTHYLDSTDDHRKRVSRDTQLCKNTCALRTEVERYFSRLGERKAEQTSHYKLRVVQKQMTIPHLSMSLITKSSGYRCRVPRNHPMLSDLCNSS